MKPTDESVKRWYRISTSISAARDFNRFGSFLLPFTPCCVFVIHPSREAPLSLGRTTHRSYISEVTIEGAVVPWSDTVNSIGLCTLTQSNMPYLTSLGEIAPVPFTIQTEKPWLQGLRTIASLPLDENETLIRPRNNNEPVCYSFPGDGFEVSRFRNLAIVLPPNRDFSIRVQIVGYDREVSTR